MCQSIIDHLLLDHKEISYKHLLSVTVTRLVFHNSLLSPTG